MNQLLNIAQIIISVLLVITILLQQRSGGLSGVFGGEGATFATRRGAEKYIFIASVILAVLFIVTSIIRLFLV